MLSIHAAGGRKMLEAAADGARDGAAASPPKVVAVTVLTSLDSSSLSELTIENDPAELVARWAELARESGLDGVVASAREAAALRRQFGKGLLIVTPGIRPASSAIDDQRRVVTPAQAVRAGADVLVVGRPITAADDPAAAVSMILEEMASTAPDQL